MSTLELAPLLAGHTALCGAQPPAQPSPPTRRPSAPPPISEFGRQILTYSIPLNICLGQEREPVVYLGMGRHFMMLSLQGNVNLEFTSTESHLC